MSTHNTVFPLAASSSCIHTYTHTHTHTHAHTHTYIVTSVNNLTCALTYYLFGRILFKYGIYLYFHYPYTAAAAKSLQSCPTLCNPIDGSPPGSPIPGILQARTLEWVAISFSKAWKWKVKVKSLSHVRLWATPWTAAYQAPPSMGFSRQEHWSGVPSPSPSIYC